MIYPEPEKLKRKQITGNGEHSGVSQQRLSDARAVLAASTAKANLVLAGNESLAKASADIKEDEKRAQKIQWDRE